MAPRSSALSSLKFPSAMRSAAPEHGCSPGHRGRYHCGFGCGLSAVGRECYMGRPHLLRKVRCCCCRRSRCAAALTPQRRVRSPSFCSASCAGLSSNAAAAPAPPRRQSYRQVHGDQRTIRHEQMYAPLQASPMTEHFRCAASPTTLVEQDLKPPPVAGSTSCGGVAPMPPAASVSAAAAAASSTCPAPNMRVTKLLWRTDLLCGSRKGCTCLWARLICE